MTFGSSGVIERAYQLAQISANVEQIRLQLRKEGYPNVDAHLAGPKIRSDLLKVIRRTGESPDLAGGGVINGEPTRGN